MWYRHTWKCYSETHNTDAASGQDALLGSSFVSPYSSSNQNMDVVWSTCELVDTVWRNTCLHFKCRHWQMSVATTLYRFQSVPYLLMWHTGRSKIRIPSAEHAKEGSSFLQTKRTSIHLVGSGCAVNDLKTWISFKEHWIISSLLFSLET